MARESHLRLNLRYYVILTMVLCLGSLFLFQASQAYPVLPSSFYGTVQVDGANVPPGTTIQALIENRVFAEGETQMYEGKSVYSLNIPGDDNDTPEMDGDREGDLISFEIDASVAEQSGVWHSGTNVELNLTASSNPNQVEVDITSTPSPSDDQPTATPIPQIPPTATIQAENSVNSIATATILPSPSLITGNTPNQIEQSMYETAVFENEEPNLNKTQEEAQSLQTAITSTEIEVETPDENSPGNISQFFSTYRLILGFGVIAIVVGIAFWIWSNRK